MAVKPLPKKLVDDAEKKIEDFISKGGKTVEESKKDKDFQMVTLRVPKSFLKHVDKIRSQSIGMTRNAFILQAIQKHLENNS